MCLQPSNLLLNSECVLKLADFGLARSLADLKADGMTNAQLTDYVATRWYRAPEILLGSHKYTFGVDMWSCGCILGELLTGRPIFPGKSTMNQLDLIFEVTGVPSPEEASRIGSPYCSQMLEMSGAPKYPAPHRFPDAFAILWHLLLDLSMLKNSTDGRSCACICLRCSLALPSYEQKYTGGLCVHAVAARAVSGCGSKLMDAHVYEPHVCPGTRLDQPKDVRAIFPQATRDAADLLKKLLVFDPEKRLTAAEALRHPYVANFHDPANEPRCSRPVTIPINDNEKVLRPLCFSSPSCFTQTPGNLMTS